jgi:hypothetical protein
LPFAGPRDFTGPERAPLVGAASAPLSTVLRPVHLDPLTVADDNKFLEKIAQQPNLPPGIKTALHVLY